MSSAGPSPYVPSTIGLCLSGGGFRAAAFHLGTLSYLQRIGWLSRVSVLSTVSGGTLTGARYAVALLDHDYSYEKFFREYRTQLKETQFFRLALGNLAEPLVSSRARRRKIITAMTDVYATTLYQNPSTKLPYFCLLYTSPSPRDS